METVLAGFGGVGAGGTEQLAAQTGVGVGIAGTGSVAANGALTLGTALLASAPYTQGVYLYFPAGACYAGSAAGFFLVKMSTTTAGTIFDNSYLASAGMPSIPTSPTAISAAGPGAYTGNTGTQTAFQYILPANSLGKNGCVNIDQLTTYTNSAGTKTFITVFGGTNVLNAAPTTTSQCYQIRTIFNRGVTNAQIIPPVGQFSIGTATAGTFVGMAVDTTAAVTITCTIANNTATDNSVLEFMRLSTVYVP